MSPAPACCRSSTRQHHLLYPFAYWVAPVLYPLSGVLSIRTHPMPKSLSLPYCIYILFLLLLPICLLLPTLSPSVFYLCSVSIQSPPHAIHLQFLSPFYPHPMLSLSNFYLYSILPLFGFYLCSISAPCCLNSLFLSSPPSVLPVTPCKSTAYFRQIQPFISPYFTNMRYSLYSVISVMLF